MESFQWLKPSPLWNPAGATFAQPELFAPRVLKYESDDFVEEFIADAARRDATTLAARVLRGGHRNGDRNVAVPI